MYSETGLKRWQRLYPASGRHANGTTCAAARGPTLVSPIKPGPPKRGQLFNESDRQGGVQWQCLDCGHIGDLGRHGNCGKCSSKAVTTKIHMSSQAEKQAVGF